MIEIRVRRFYKCDEGIVIPSRTYTIDETAKRPPSFKLASIIEKIDAEMKDLPGTNWRLMTEAEVDDYCGTEESEDMVAV